MNGYFQCKRKNVGWYLQEDSSWKESKWWEAQVCSTKSRSKILNLWFICLKKPKIQWTSFHIILFWLLNFGPIFSLYSFYLFIKCDILCKICHPPYLCIPRNPHLLTIWSSHKQSPSINVGKFNLVTFISYFYLFIFLNLLG